MAMLNVANVANDYYAKGETAYFRVEDGQQLPCVDNSKFILAMRLEWALDDIIFYLDKEAQRPIDFEQVERTVFNIMESDVIEPIDFLTTTLFVKIRHTL